MINEQIKKQNMKMPTHKSKSLAAHPCNHRLAAKHMLFLPTLIQTVWIPIETRMIRQTIFTIGLILITTISFGQNRELYDYAYTEVHKMLKGESQLDFKKAVFLSENAFYGGKLDYKTFCQRIDDIEVQINRLINEKGVANHVMGKQFAIFSYMMEPSKFNNFQKISYNFEDFLGNKDWASMFVTKLLETKQGNCHSLPYLYKILSEEIKAEAYLALAPNHMYIKIKDDKGMWVNIELTNGGLPRDVWIMSSLSITTEAIKSGTYMEALTLKESVSLCLYDLALNYQSQFGHDDFGLKCCDTLIKYYPHCIYGYMVKSEILVEQRKTLLLANSNQRIPEIIQLEKTITGLYNQIDKMGYKDMPKEQYEQWVKDVENERSKQQHK